MPLSTVSIDRPLPPQDTAVVDAQLQRWELARPGHDAWALGTDEDHGAIECVDFYEGRQIPGPIRRKLIEMGRTPVVLNQIAPKLRLLWGHFRQTQRTVRYLASQDMLSSADVAETLTHLSAAIDEDQGSAWKHSQVFLDTLLTGRGYLDCRIDMAENVLGKITEEVLDPFSVLIDPDSDSPDPKDWAYCINMRWLSAADIALMYGAEAMREIPIHRDYQAPLGGSRGYYLEEEPTPLTRFGLSRHLTDLYARTQGDPFDTVHRHRRLLRVVDCQHQQLKEVTQLIDPTTGEIKDIPEGWSEERLRAVVQWYQKQSGVTLAVRKVIKRQWRWTVTCGDVVLWDEWSPYQTPTIIPCWGHFRRGVTRGFIHDLIDPQIEINKRRMSLLQIVASSAYAGWMVEEGSLSEEQMQTLEQAGAKPGVILRYAAGRNPPQRIQPPAPPTIFAQLEVAAAQDLTQISGVNESALGHIDKVQSGRAIEARQRQAIVGAMSFTDGFDAFLERVGRKRLALIQSYYTQERIIRVRGEGEGDQTIVINRRDAAGKIVNDVVTGSYATTVDQTPASASFAQGQFEEALEMRQQGIPIPDDVMIDMSSAPNKRRIKQQVLEQKDIAAQQARMQAAMASMQAGKPLDQAWPTIPVDGPQVAGPAAPPQPFPPPQAGPPPGPQPGPPQPPMPPQVPQ